MRVLVTGGAGQLARSIARTWVGHELMFPEESILDLGRPEAIDSVLRDLHPEVVVNTGAFTQVDRCETDEAAAMRINGEAVGWLARACDREGALLVQISTDYVFDGTSRRPYLETDPTHPLSVYGKSKLLGEQNAARAEQHLVVRTAWLYDHSGRNFLNTMLTAASQGRKLRVVDDQKGAPTSCGALARQLLAAVDEGWRGMVHCTCAGETSWYGFAREIFRSMAIAADLAPCTTAEYPLPAPRPAYSVLDGRRRALLGRDLMPDWREALAEVVACP
jgi:dTDP-4-dehydrorhamnose reductase